jgi:hypothetical protein
MLFVGMLTKLVDRFGAYRARGRVRTTMPGRIVLVPRTCQRNRGRGDEHENEEERNNTDEN